MLRLVFVLSNFLGKLTLGRCVPHVSQSFIYGLELFPLKIIEKIKDSNKKIHNTFGVPCYHEYLLRLIFESCEESHKNNLSPKKVYDLYTTQSTFACLKLTTETLERGVRSVQS